MDTATRQEATRILDAGAAEIFAVLCDPAGHVEIDSSGMLQDFTGGPVSAVGDSFVVHMDREALGDLPMGRYDVTVTIETFEPDAEISWSILGTVRPGIGHRYGYTLSDTDGGTLVTSFCDWSNARSDMVAIFPVVPQSALRATLGILDRVVRARRIR
ncbi:polyketide cyclase [Rudaeicoccus suwonensis]|uniref:Polyketide cyclase/dehydrase/lipid transport protein n=1 Tax=Rudaeicoccus suwonensis TaxID=657409 RepID=A0A561E9C2_9MICO|nr:polyketide cyclase [Rudaeicoccus suwonensis]TWE12214.1 hypothetical protein BKA23_1014 [Rudaeicoccus suwonensis]